MKTPLLTGLLVATALVCEGAAPLDTGFIYQGLLTEAGKPNPGKFNFEHYYDLYDSPTGGNRVAGPVTNSVEVTDGVFTTVIDFGAAVFDGGQYWLEIGVRTNSTAAFTMLAPRQPVRPTPYALRALSASSVAPGSVGNGALLPNALSADKIASGQVVKSFNGLNDSVELAVEGDLELRQVGNTIVLAPAVSCFTYSNCYWNLRGNGNVGAGVNFLGTVAGELDPLEFRVNNNRSLLHVFTAANTAPNLIGGYRGNIVAATGGTIAGGGQLTGINQVLANYGTVSGGYTNVIEGFSTAGTIGGGHGNTIENTVEAGTIGGGVGNLLLSGIYTPTIGGGLGNYISGLFSATIAGGEHNTNRAGYGSIGGGRRNVMFGADGTIGGGRENTTLADAATISGGQANRIDSDSEFAAIGGGGNHLIGTNSPDTTVSGGQRNVIDPNTALATIGGGGTNRILALAVGATVAGGTENIVTTTAPHATIPGGRQAAALSYGQMAYASGNFASPGDAQTSVYVVRNSTSTNSGAGLVVDLFLDGAARRIRVPVDSAWTFEVSIAARDAGGNSAAYLARGTIENNAGATAFPVMPVMDTLNEDVAAWSVQLIADNANDALVIRVTGSLAAPVRWVATVRTTEVVFP